MFEIAVQIGDVCEVQCDVLILKYAQAFYGADSVVASILRGPGKDEIEIAPQPGGYTFVPSNGSIGARWALFVGVARLTDFDYLAVRSFAAQALPLALKAGFGAKHVAMTMHGAGYGLDEREAFLAQLGGIMDAAAKGEAPDRITIVERNVGRAARLKAILWEVWPAMSSDSTSPFNKPIYRPTAKITAGTDSENKSHIFVAMPFSKDLEDVFVFGIQGPINEAGYLCERVDMVTFTGDILEHIKRKIESAVLVVADLTGANPNVYLEVGYAWGTNRPTLLILNKNSELKFDARGQRCIIYENIVDLSKRLRADFNAMKIL